MRYKEFNPKVVLEKCITLFWNKGYGSCSISDIVQETGVNRYSLYDTFENKKGILIAALNLYFERYSTKHLELLVPEKPLRESLKDFYVSSCSDPVLQDIRESSGGLEAFRVFFNKLIEALLNKTFPRSCLIVNLVVELRDEEPQVTDIYNRYFKNMIESYTIVLKRAYTLGEIKRRDRIDEYAEFLVGVIFGLGILYKIKSRKELEDYVDEQLSLLE